MTEETKSTTVANNEELIEKHNQMVQFVKNTISTIETDLKRMKLVLNKLSKFDPNDPKSLDDKEITEAIWTEELKTYTEENVQVVEWKFDGYFMVWADQKKYPVPLNYSSKTKLVPGDILKLKIKLNFNLVIKIIVYCL